MFRIAKLKLTPFDLVATGTYRENDRDRPEMMLVKDLVIGTPNRTSGLYVIVPMEYITDRFSLPHIINKFQPHSVGHVGPSVAHDWLYDLGDVPRAKCDYIMRTAMKEANIEAKYRWLAWAGVRANGLLSAATLRRGGYNQPLAQNAELVNRFRLHDGIDWLLASQDNRFDRAVSRLNRLRARNGLDPWKPTEKEQA